MERRCNRGAPLIIGALLLFLLFLTLGSPSSETFFSYIGYTKDGAGTRGIISTTDGDVLYVKKGDTFFETFKVERIEGSGIFFRDLGNKRYFLSNTAVEQGARRGSQQNDALREDSTPPMLPAFARGIASRYISDDGTLSDVGSEAIHVVRELSLGLQDSPLGKDFAALATTLQVAEHEKLKHTLVRSCSCVTTIGEKPLRVRLKDAASTCASLQGAALPDGAAILTCEEMVAGALSTFDVDW